MEGEQAILTGTREDAAPVKPRMEMAEAGTRGGCEGGGMKGHVGGTTGSLGASGHGGVQGYAPSLLSSAGGDRKSVV